MPLLDWQRALQGATLGSDASVQRLLKPDAPMVRRGIGIYASAYVYRLSEAFRDNYPALQQLLGDDGFDALARSYLRAWPSTQASIRWFGDRLPLYLQQTQPYADMPVLSELASLEWALRHTVDAADVTAMTVDELSSLAAESWGALRIALHPSLTILDFYWNVLPIWQALSQEHAPPLPQAADGSCLVWRAADYVSTWRSCEAWEARALRTLGSGESLGALCESPALANLEPDRVPMLIAAMMKAGAQGGYLYRAPPAD